jgi:ABC-type dipeptide/oligopeptide/nickel transport system permease subunit
MNGKENPVELLVICAVMVVLGVLGVISGLSRGLLGSLDGLLMLFVALMMALIFGLLLLVLAKQQGWLGRHRKSEGPSPTPATSK